jgi:invasion protein IalB
MAQAQLPINIATRAPVGLRLSDADPGVSGLLDRCTAGGCFAEIELKDDFVKKFLAADGVGKLTFKDAGGHDVAIPVSMKGFKPAYEAMAKE